MKQILYGVGKSLLKKYTDPTKIIAMSELKDLTVQFSGDEEEVTGGDGLYPLAYFPKAKSITISATNATFDIGMLEMSQNTVSSTGAVEMTEIFNYEIPSGGVVELEHEPNVNSIVVNGYTAYTGSNPIPAGQYKADIDSITFSTEDIGKEITGYYERQTSSKATSVAGLKDGMSQTAIFIHRIPIYDDNTTIVGQGQLTIFKCKSDGNFEFNFAEKTAYAPKFSLKALDPKRADKKLWDFVIDPVA